MACVLGGVGCGDDSDVEENPFEMFTVDDVDDIEIDSPLADEPKSGRPPRSARATSLASMSGPAVSDISDAGRETTCDGQSAMQPATSQPASPAGQRSPNPAQRRSISPPALPADRQHVGCPHTTLALAATCAGLIPPRDAAEGEATTWKSRVSGGCPSHNAAVLLRDAGSTATASGAAGVGEASTEALVPTVTSVCGAASHDDNVHQEASAMQSIFVEGRVEGQIEPGSASPPGSASARAQGYCAPSPLPSQSSLCTISKCAASVTNSVDTAEVLVPTFWDGCSIEKDPTIKNAPSSAAPEAQSTPPAPVCSGLAAQPGVAQGSASQRYPSDARQVPVLALLHDKLQALAMGEACGSGTQRLSSIGSDAPLLQVPPSSPRDTSPRSLSDDDICSALGDLPSTKPPCKDWAALDAEASRQPVASLGALSACASPLDGLHTAYTPSLNSPSAVAQATAQAAQSQTVTMQGAEHVAVHLQTPIASPADASPAQRIVEETHANIAAEVKLLADAAPCGAQEAVCANMAAAATMCTAAAVLGHSKSTETWYAAAMRSAHTPLAPNTSRSISAARPMEQDHRAGVRGATRSAAQPAIQQANALQGFKRGGAAGVPPFGTPSNVHRSITAAACPPAPRPTSAAARPHAAGASGTGAPVLYSSEQAAMLGGSTSCSVAPPRSAGSSMFGKRRAEAPLPTGPVHKFPSKCAVSSARPAPPVATMRPTVIPPHHSSTVAVQVASDVELPTPRPPHGSLLKRMPAPVSGPIEQGCSKPAKQVCRDVLAGTGLLHEGQQRAAAVPSPMPIAPEQQLHMAAGSYATSALLTLPSRHSPRAAPMAMRTGNPASTRAALVTPAAEASSPVSAAATAAAYRSQNINDIQQQQQQQCGPSQGNEPPAQAPDNAIAGPAQAHLASAASPLPALQARSQPPLTASAHVGGASGCRSEQQASRQPTLQEVLVSDGSVVPDRREDLAKFNEQLHEMAIDLDAATDLAIEFRVKAAITNNNWAKLAQPLYFDQAAAMLERAKCNLHSASSAAQEGLSLARHKGWL